jgi:acyl dehydratase
MTGAALHKPGDTFSIERGPITTTQLVMYAGASGDFNRIHYDHMFAVRAGLGGLLGHGMLTMAFAGSCAVQAFGPASRIAHLEARFTAPVRVGDVVKVTATVADGGGADAIEATLVADVDGQVVLRGVVKVVPILQAPPSAGDVM